MTKEITKAYILQELEDSLKLRELVPETFAFSELVIPIYDIEKHLTKWKSDYESVNITAAQGFLFFTVPDDERWKLRRYDVIFMGVGGFTIAGVYVRRRDMPDVFLDLKAAQSASYHIDLINPVVLNPGDKLQITVDGYTGTYALRLYIDYSVVKIR